MLSSHKIHTNSQTSTTNITKINIITGKKEEIKDKERTMVIGETIFPSTVSKDHMKLIINWLIKFNLKIFTVKSNLSYN